MSSLTRLLPRGEPRFDLLAPLRHWLNRMEVNDLSVATRICQIIPCSCPFERTLTVWGYRLHIPPLCKLNPLYNEVVNLRYRALKYLADDCGADITPYIC